MIVRETALPGVLLIAPRVFRDDRGQFFESYHATNFEAIGITCVFVQDNLSVSTAGVIRGLHYQVPKAQAKLIQVVAGSVLDVAVDIRRGSPTFGKWVGEVLSEENHHQLFLPPGFAHGFAVLGDRAVLSYKCSELYDPTGDSTIAWDDPDIGIEWPFTDPLLSPKDKAAPRLIEVPTDRMPVIES
jgi:dTDP-4-dehydrorhamnose 3,5-epimerase